MAKKILPLAVIVLLALTSCTKNSPEAVADRFYDALQRSAYTEALAYTNVPAENLEQTATLIEKMGMHLYAYEVLSSEMEEGDSTAVVQASTVVTFDEGTDTVNASPMVRCVKVDGEWKVVFFM